jgi:hypothetical protein
MTWDQEHQFLLGCVVLVSSMMSMIFVAILGYHVTWFVVNAAHQKGKKDQGRNGKDLRVSEEG